MGWSHFVLIAIGVALTVGVIVFIVKRTLKKTQYTAVDVLKLETVIQFFKKPDILAALHKDKNLIATAVRDVHNHQCVLCIFNKSTNQVQTEFLRYKYAKMDDDLLALFGDKDMIILT